MMRRLLAVLRILIGLLLIYTSIKKWRNPAYFQAEGFANILAQKGAPFPFYKVLLDSYVFPHTMAFATLAAVVESTVGGSFLLGAFTTPASIAGMVMIANFDLATSYGNPGNIAGHLFLIGLMALVGFTFAGRTWGADALLARAISPRLLFFPFGARFKAVSKGGAQT